MLTQQQFEHEMKLMDVFEAFPRQLHRQIEKAFGEAHPDWQRELEDLVSAEPQKGSVLKHHTKMRAQIQRHCAPKQQSRCEREHRCRRPGQWER